MIIASEELTSADKLSRYAAAKAKAISLLMEKKVINSPDEAVTRQVVIGDANATDFKDLTVATTAGSGMEEWLIDSAALIAGDIKNIISTTSGAEVSQVSQTSAMVFFGFADASGTKDCTSVQFGKGAKTLDTWNVEALYAYNIPVGYLADVNDMIWFAPNDTVKLGFGWRIGATAVSGEDYKWVVLGVLAESKSKSAAASA